MPWTIAFLRGTKVFARVNSTGEFAVENGRVEIRYKPNDGRKYGARADNLTVVSGEILPDETCSEANTVDAKAKAKEPSAGETTTPETKRTPTPKRAKTAKEKIANVTGDSPDEHTANAMSTHGTALNEAIVHVYADGACSGNPGPAGLGVVVLDTESRVELSEYIGNGTNNIAELTAILRALGEIADSERAVVIHTDSSYSIGVLQKGWKAKANQDLVAELREHLKVRKRTRLVYVPGHAGVKWNERADSLARAAVMSKKTTRNVVRSTSG
ncbi:MAG: ribonuclease HI [Polyangiaceae bacterium]|nr:ribonuclease HI [Polyangiaceae bacterium]